MLALGDRDRQISEFKVSLVYKASARTVSKATQRNLVSKNQNNNNTFSIWEAVHVEFRGQLVEARSLLPAFGCQGWNSGPRV